MKDIVGILLAAGAGRRFGAPKLLQRLPSGEAVGIAAARNLVAAVPAAVAVVRPGDLELAAAYAALGLRAIENRHADEGMGRSLAVGIAASADAAGWLIALADMPWIQPRTIGALAESLARGASLVAPAVNGRRGHPVGFHQRWRTQLQALSGDQGARTLLAAHADELLLHPTADAGVLLDIDRVADLNGA